MMGLAFLVATGIGIPNEGDPTLTESLQLPAIFRFRFDARALPAAAASDLRRLPSQPSAYLSGVVSGCMFEPGVAFAFPSRSELIALLCFKCEEIAFARGRELLRKLMLSKQAKEGLWNLSRKVFPELGMTKSRKGAAEQPVAADERTLPQEPPARR